LFAASQPGNAFAEKGKTRQQNKKKKGKKNKDSKQNVKSNLRIDGLGNTDANL
jgi:hypothetical protein